MKFQFVIFLLGFSINLLAQTIGFNWARQFTGSSNQSDAMFVTSTGETYLAGRYTGLIDLDPGAGTYTFNSAFNNHLPYVCKLDAYGYFIWGGRFAAVSNSPEVNSASSIVADNNGDVYVGGTFAQVLDFDPGAGSYTMDPMQGSIYICKLTGAGQFVWAKQVGDSSGRGSCKLMTDQQNNLVVAGAFYGHGDFDPGVGQYLLNSNGFSDVFVLKLSTSGVFNWAKLVGGTGYDGLNSMTVDQSSNVIIGGSFQNAVDFDPGPGNFILSANNGKAFVVKLFPNGSFSFAKQYDGAGADDLESDPFRNIYVVDSYSGTANISTGPSVNTVTSNGLYDVVVSKLDSSGNFIWGRTVGGAGTDGGNCITVDTTRNVYYSGTFFSTVDFDPGPGVTGITSQGQNDIFISKLDSAGNFRWSRAIGGNSSDVSTEMIWTPAQDLFLAGYFFQTCDFDPGPGSHTMTTNTHNSFAAKYIRCGMPLQPSVFPASFSACGNSIFTLTAAGTGSISWKNGLVAGNYVGSGSTYITPTLSPGSYSYYAVSVNDCAEGPNSAPVTITVFPLPSLSIASSASVICAGDTATITATGAQTYTWSGNQNANSIVIVPASTTSYSVQGTAANGCNGSATYVQVVSLCGVGISERSADHLRIFPNPFCDYIFVENAGKASLKIFDALGREYKAAEFDAGINRLMLTDLPPGVYFIRINDTAIPVKFLKE